MVIKKDPETGHVFRHLYADFSNLDELYDILVGPDPVVLMRGQDTPLYPLPFVGVLQKNSRHIYVFMKQDDNTYILKVVANDPGMASESDL